MCEAHHLPKPDFSVLCISYDAPDGGRAHVDRQYLPHIFLLIGSLFSLIIEHIYNISYFFSSLSCFFAAIFKRIIAYYIYFDYIWSFGWNMFFSLRLFVHICPILFILIHFLLLPLFKNAILSEKEAANEIYRTKKTDSGIP